MDNIFKKENVFVINLDKRKDRLKSITEQLGSVNIPFTRFSAIRPDIEKIKNDDLWKNSYQGINKGKSERWNQYLKGALGCKMSHYNIIKNAKDNDLDYVVIFEDDALICENAIKKIEEINLFFNYDEWDMLYLGGFVPDGKKNIEKYKFIKKVKSNFQTIGYIIKKKSYDKLLKYIISEKNEIDNIYMYLQKKKIIKAYHCEIVEQNFKDSNIRGNCKW